MALEENVDYVFCPKTTYVGKLGVGDGCLVGTARLLLMVPLKVDSAVWHHKITTRKFQLGDEPIDIGIARVLGESQLSVDDLEDFLRQVASNIDGAVIADLQAAKRVRVRSSFFSKGIYHSDREKGPGWTGYPLRGKELAKRWVAFYEKLPNFVP